MADKELDKNQQEEDIDIDALFAKMMADKAASGEEIKQAKEDPEKAAPQPEAEKYAVAENSQETEEEPADGYRRSTCRNGTRRNRGICRGRRYR